MTFHCLSARQQHLGRPSCLGRQAVPWPHPSLPPALLSSGRNFAASPLLDGPLQDAARQNSGNSAPPENDPGRGPETPIQCKSSLCLDRSRTQRMGRQSRVGPSAFQVGKVGVGIKVKVDFRHQRLQRRQENQDFSGINRRHGRMQTADIIPNRHHQSFDLARLAERPRPPK